MSNPYTDECYFYHPILSTALPTAPDRPDDAAASSPEWCLTVGFHIWAGDADVSSQYVFFFFKFLYFFILIARLVV